ncbi:MAG: DNA primase [Burkholderiaceae bacterium]
MIPQSFIDDLLRRVDIVDLVGQHVSLKKAGSNYSGLCPFHNEKSPSFTVSPAKQFYHCFGCGASGTAIGFLIEHLGLSFPQAVEELARRQGLEVPQQQDASESSKEDRKTQADLRSRLEARMREAARFYQRRLKDSPEAIEYLKNRGITGESAARYHLGYAPPGWQSLQAVFADYQDNELMQAGLVIEEPAGRRYDRFRNRIMFPILGMRGEVIGFGARTLGDDTPKYLNSPETPIFTKGGGLYGLFEARKAIREAGEIWVVEGYMDVVVLAQYGIGHVVATLGTATTADHLRILSRQTSRIVVMFDGDRAGQKAAARALEVMLPFASPRLQVRFAFLPSDHDPDSFVRQFGREALLQLVETAPPLSRFVLDRAAAGQSLDFAEGRAAATAEAKRLLALMSDSPLKAQIAQDAARQFQTDLQALGVVTARQSGFQPRRAQPSIASAGARPSASAQGSIRRQAERILQILIQVPKAYQSVVEHDHFPLAREQFAQDHLQLLDWIGSRRHSPSQAGLYEAAQREDPQSGLVVLFQKLSSPDPALEAIFQADNQEAGKGNVGNELSRAIRVLAVRSMQKRATDLAARPELRPEDLSALRQLQSEIQELKAVLRDSDESSIM